MQGMLVRARRMSAWLGCAGVLGLSGVARAESVPCACTTSNQSVVSELPCLIFRTSDSCGASSVRNACEQTVTLVDWPLLSCMDRACTQALAPGEEAGFTFGMEEFETDRLAEQSYTVRVDGEDQRLTISAEVTCRDASDSNGCAAAPSALGAAGVALLVGAVVRRRRGA